VKLIWATTVPPARSLVAWKILQNKIPLDIKLQQYGISLCSRCGLCKADQETLQHIFFHYNVTSIFWKWLAEMFNTNTICNNINDVLHFMEKQCSSQLKDIRIVACINIFWIILKMRNITKYDTPITLSIAFSILNSNRKMASNISKGTMHNNIEDFIVIKSFNVNVHPKKSQ